MSSSHLHRRQSLLLFTSIITTICISSAAYRYYKKRQHQTNSCKDLYDACYQVTDNVPASSDTLILTDAHTCSCTGKVLIAGGYLVLEQPNVGLVLSVDARFHSTVAQLTPEQLSRYVQPHTHHSTNSITDRYIPIVVYTPQRQGVIPTVYELHFDGPSFNVSTISLHQLTTATEHNIFVYTSLLYTLAIICTICNDDMIYDKLSDGLILYLTGDYQFYSAEPLITSQRADGKTGLGSSAALVSSLVAALYSYFDIVPQQHNNAQEVTLLLPQPANCKLPDNQIPNISLSSQQCITIAHHTAQFVHCLAQGKVGSGFDVSAAYYGTQRYVRYSTSCIQHLIDHCTTHKHVTDVTRVLLLAYMLPNDIKELMHDDKYKALIQPDPHCCVTCAYTQRTSWDYSIEPLPLPANLTLVLADVQGGAKTPSMVKNVLQWRKHLSDDDTTSEWAQLAQHNNTLDQQLRRFHEQSTDNDEYTLTCNIIAKTPVAQWSNTHIGNADVRARLSDIHTTFSSIRQALKSMGQKCNADIEPDTQSSLLDLTSATNGVLLCGVPGAGGDDAIFALLLSNNTAVDEVEQVWRQYAQQTDKSIQRLPVRQDPGGLNVQVEEIHINV